MGTILTSYGPAAYDHEGYVAQVLDDGTITGSYTTRTRPRMIGRVVAACDCGWTGTTRYPTTSLVDEQAQTRALTEWEHTHARPVLDRDPVSGPDQDRARPPRQAARTLLAARDEIDASWEAPRPTMATPRQAPRDSTSESPAVVVALCGSTRFLTQIAQAARQETIAGRIVPRPECDLKTPDPLWPPERIEHIKQDLDALHRAKIRLADEVLVITPNGYIGESTRAEIAYATELGRPIRYWPVEPR